ncbi:MAG: hypothetical protein E7044_13480 [Lentisphaerae bacterium]|nr:hypothetical protein [Lentisphaerota bacterium]
MIFGILAGLTAAFLNSIGYLFSAFFLKKSNSPFKLLVFAQTWMLIFSVPFIWFLLPENGIADPGKFFKALAYWVVVFCTGQASFFLALRHFEASRLSSLLGLKIIVLTVIYMFVNRSIPNAGQWLAVFMAAAAAMLINYSAGNSWKSKGWLYVFVTLICYSLSDINETTLVLCLVDSGLSPLRSAFAATMTNYVALGILTLPGLFFFKPDKTFHLSAPYAAFWLLSQVSLMTCFALVAPVFGNVILASRGIFSVLLGALLAVIGIKGVDANISKKQWIRRGIAALLMVLAIGIYSFSTAK